MCAAVTEATGGLTDFGEAAVAYGRLWWKQRGLEIFYYTLSVCEAWRLVAISATCQDVEVIEYTLTLTVDSWSFLAQVEGNE